VPAAGATKGKKEDNHNHSGNTEDNIAGNPMLMRRECRGKKKITRTRTRKDSSSHQKEKELIKNYRRLWLHLRKTELREGIPAKNYPSLRMLAKN